MAGIIESLKWYIPTFFIQFNHWGRTMAMAGSQIIFVGGFLALLYGFPISFVIGIYSILLGGLVFPFAYPFATLQKRGLLSITQNYKLVGPGLLTASIPCYFTLPTILGAVPLSVSGLFYIYAALRNEKSLTKEQIMKGANI